MNNIIDFANKYDPTEIVLENNYRSDQRILDWSKALIENNSERLVKVRTHRISPSKVYRSTSSGRSMCSKRERSSECCQY